MNLSQIPGPIEKRDILYGVKKLSASEMRSLVDSLFNEGWFSDAADFYGHTQDHEGLKKIRAIAVNEGNTFLFLKVSRLLGEVDPPRDDLSKCAANAEAKGMTRYAIKAYEKLGDTDKMAALKATVSTDGDIVAEAEQSVFIPETEDEFLEGEAQED